MYLVVYVNTVKCLLCKKQNCHCLMNYSETAYQKLFSPNGPDCNCFCLFVCFSPWAGWWWWWQQWQGNVGDLAMELRMAFNLKISMPKTPDWWDYRPAKPCPCRPSIRSPTSWYSTLMLTHELSNCYTTELERQPWLLLLRISVNGSDGTTWL